MSAALNAIAEAETPTDTPPPDAAPTATPAPINTADSTDTVTAATNIKEAVASGNGTIGGIIERLDSYSFDVGSTHISLWSAAVVLFVIAAVLLFARLGSKLAHWLLGKLTRLDFDAEAALRKAHDDRGVGAGDTDRYRYTGN